MLCKQCGLFNLLQLKIYQVFRDPHKSSNSNPIVPLLISIDFIHKQGNLTESNIF
jgi:hypothetical protein